MCAAEKNADCFFSSRFFASFFPLFQVDSCVMADFRSGAPGCSAWTIAQPAEIVGHQCLDETKNVSCPYGYVHQVTCPTGVLSINNVIKKCRGF